jgi:hypothetical protein
MSIQGIGPGAGLGGVLPGVERRSAPEESAPQAIRPQDLPQANPEALQQSRDLVPSDAPAGTDPALWAVLTAEERSFFARARTMGPLTYGPGAARGQKIPGILQGGRIDVRV